MAEPNEVNTARSFTTYQVTPPSKFSFKSSEWTRWIRRFERFRIATELDKKEEAKQVNALMYILWATRQMTYNNIVWSQRTRNDKLRNSSKQV